MATLTTQSATFSNLILDIMAREIILETKPNFIFKNFVRIKEDITNKPGTRVVFTKINSLKGGGPVDEMDFIETQTFTTSVVDVIAREFGNSVEYTNLATKASFVDLYETIKENLAVNYVEVIDNYLRNIYFSQILNIYYYNNTYAGAGAPAGATQPFDTNAIRYTVARLKTMLIPPMIIDGKPYYICVLSPSQMTTLRQDPTFYNAYYYSNPSIFYYGQSGVFEGVILIESDLVPRHDLGGGNFRREALFLGDYQMGMAIASELKIIEDPPQDLGRFRRVGWYQILGARIINQHGFRVYTNNN